MNQVPYNMLGSYIRIFKIKKFIHIPKNSHFYQRFVLVKFYDISFYFIYIHMYIKKSY